ncbi:lactate utilization protein [Acidaminobacter sp. JC074]|uniref:lactate utilization protein n=1 Tax=Acidaminobacter sp. JC074 TaxID=2530199 RepID=UPI001F1078F6|nr:lactate utilization protein [Acidaminobacter sp. JC074]MCH4888880.1 lactate utilization protein [Acidaminobacter sp. JC074]
MDNNVKIVVKKRVDKTIKNLEKRNMSGYYANDLKELKEIIDRLIPDNSSVTVGGSMTLFETGIIDHLRERDLTFYDRYEEGLTPEDIKEIYFKAFGVDGYFASTNAITEEGEIYNVDGRGNRVAAMIYGPEKVILVVGTNKIVKDLDEAFERNRRLAAPANVQRLSRKTPCHTTGYCTRCNSPEKICHAHTIIDGQMIKDRMHVIFVDGYYGY